MSNSVETAIETGVCGAQQMVSNKELGAGVSFSRIRRVTGYLSEDTAFNNGKKAELRDRVKHMKA